MVTLAIHTYARALLLKSILESEGVDVALQNVNLVQPVPGAGVRVRVREQDLPLALKIVENIDIYGGDCGRQQKEADTPLPPKKDVVVMAPVDFSPHSEEAAATAFAIATGLRARVVLLNAYLDPMVPVSMELNDELAFSDEVETVEDNKIISGEAEKKMADFANAIRDKIKDGALPAVRFSTDVREGAPEDVVEAVERQLKPALIVMGTRGSNPRQRQLVGSVTAEVLDTARFPVLTVPDTDFDVSKVRKVMLLAQLDQGDILALDTLHRLLPDGKFSIKVVTLVGRREPAANAHAQLIEYCRKHYPGFDFDSEEVKMHVAEDDFAKLETGDAPDLILIPSRRKNVFARIFNPGLAHRLLFQASVPMMAVPI